MEVLIRNEREEDTRAVEEVTREAFWNLYVPGCSEHYIVHTLRQHKDFIRELDYVALVAGRIVGNIMYTRASLANEKGESLDIASFGPVSVHPAYQRQGIGSRLIQHSLLAAKDLGFKVIAIYGDPHNYCKHGFRNGKDLAISDGNGEPIMLIPGCQWAVGEHWGILGLMKDEIAIRSQSRATPQSSARADCSYHSECPSAALSSLVRHGG
jgi:predicted N-acetyltransferase YhbS